MTEMQLSGLNQQGNLLIVTYAFYEPVNNQA